MRKDIAENRFPVFRSERCWGKVDGVPWGKNGAMTEKEWAWRREQIYARTNWNSRESIHRYNEAMRDLRREMMQEEDEKRDREKAEKWRQQNGRSKV